MGQAAIDLPDPKDLSSTHAGGADDLLAQLAGKEIDRLLAESDVEPEIAPLAPLAPIEKTPVAEAPKPAPELAIPTGPHAVHADETATLHEPLLQVEHHDGGSVPVWLKPLQWMNAPLDLLPSPLRELIGKVAILTTVNAIAVLAYVALFRHHR